MMPSLLLNRLPRHRLNQRLNLSARIEGVKSVPRLSDSNMPRNLHSRRFAVGAGYLIAFAVIFAMSMSVTYPPLVDYPNHLARYYIAATVDQDPLL
jgi:hypothetical protein